MIDKMIINDIDALRETLFYECITCPQNIDAIKELKERIKELRA